MSVVYPVYPRDPIAIEIVPDPQSNGSPHRYRSFLAPLGAIVDLFNRLSGPVLVWVCHQREGDRGRPEEQAYLIPPGETVRLGTTIHEQVGMRLAQSHGGTIRASRHAQTEQEMGLPNLGTLLGQRRRGQEQTS